MKNLLSVALFLKCPQDQRAPLIQSQFKTPSGLHLPQGSSNTRSWTFICSLPGCAVVGSWHGRERARTQPNDISPLPKSILLMCILSLRETMFAVLFILLKYPLFILHIFYLNLHFLIIPADSTLSLRFFFFMIILGYSFDLWHIIFSIFYCYLNVHELSSLLIVNHFRTLFYCQHFG